MNVAIIENNVVQSIPPLPDNATIAENSQSATWPADTPGAAPVLYAAPQGGTLVVATDDVRPGWTYINGVFAPPVPSLPEAKVTAAIAAEGHYRTLIAGGYTLSGTTYALDPTSITRGTAAGSAASATMIPDSGVTWPDGFTYPDASGTRHAMTAAEMLVIANALFHFVAAADNRLDDIRQAIAAAADVAAVQAIAVTAGYPAASE